VPCRASGWFEVSDKRKNLLTEEAWYSFVRTQEHIVAAHVTRTRFLLLAQSMRRDIGWWYVFFMPEWVCEVRRGYQACAFRQQPALRIRYVRSSEGKPDRVEELYLAFPDPTAARRIAADLRQSVPPGAFQD